MSKLFLGGVPTGPEVDRLMVGLAIESGTRVPYGQVEELTGLSVKEHRFRTVTNAWRKRVFREKALEVKAEGGCFVILTPDEALTNGISSFHRVGRALGRTNAKVSVINEAELSSERAATKRLLQREIGLVSDAARRAAKEIAAPKPVSTIVRLHDKVTADA